MWRFAHLIFHLLLPFLKFGILGGMKTDGGPAALAVTRFHCKVHFGGPSGRLVQLVHVEVVLSVHYLLGGTHEACALVHSLVSLLLLFAVLVCLVTSSPLLTSLVVHNARVSISDALGLLSVLMLMSFRAQKGAIAACVVGKPAIGLVLHRAQVQG